MAEFIFGPNSVTGGFHFGASLYVAPGAGTPVTGSLVFGPNKIGSAFIFGATFVPVLIADIVTTEDVVILVRDAYVIDIFPR